MATRMVMRPIPTNLSPVSHRIDTAKTFPWMPLGPRYGEHLSAPKYSKELACATKLVPSTSLFLVVYPAKKLPSLPDRARNVELLEQQDLFLQDMQIATAGTTTTTTTETAPKAVAKAMIPTTKTSCMMMTVILPTTTTIHHPIRVQRVTLTLLTHRARPRRRPHLAPPSPNPF